MYVEKVTNKVIEVIKRVCISMYASIGIGSEHISYFKDDDLLPNEATKVNIADDNHIRNDTDMRTDVFFGMLRAHSIKKFI